MTRINTNVSSLTAQKTLAQSNDQLQQSLTRLSTGLRINSGKDDPAGLIASEVLQGDIVATQKAVSNSQLANQMIATADSALGQVSSLLTDIRSLVTEAANTGALSADQIAANQLQVDSSLDALNRISQTTSFQGRRLLDGSLDFIKTDGTGMNTVTNLQIQSANLGSTGQMAVSVDITAAAKQATITASVPDSVLAVKASAKINFADGDYVTVTADTAGAAANGTTIDIVETSSIADGKVVATYNGTDAITVYVSSTADTTMANLAGAIDGIAGFGAAYTQNGAANTNFTPGSENVAQVSLDNGADAITGLTGDLVFELSGTKGSQVFTFQADTTGDQMAKAINSVSDATGVTATFAANTLTLLSTDYGTDAFVSVNEISDGGSFAPSAARATGDDIAGTINGVTANGKANTLSLNTATLALNATVADGSSTDFTFTITGGGALFQLGPDVVSNQQSRIGIQSVNTARLGGSAGKLYQLASGGTAALATDPNTAAEIVGEAVNQVTSLRGRLGAFQKTTVDSNIQTLTDTIQNLTAAQSSIRDADFAAESASLTRAQILVQSGTAVLAIANKNPENVLTLLR